MKPVNKDTGLVAINGNRVCHPRNLKIYRLDFGKLITLQISLETLSCDHQNTLNSIEH